MPSPSPSPCHHRFLIWVLAATLLAAAGLATGLVWTARHFYARELSVRLQPVGGTSLTRSGNAAAQRILFLGDSRAADWPALPADRFFTLNAGVAGETTAQIRWRAEAVLSVEKPAVVVVQAGINDLKAIGVLPEAATQIQEQCTSNILEIVSLCRQHNARVVLTLILPPGKVPLARRFVWSGKIETALREINNSLTRRYADAEGVAVFDMEKILAPTRPGSSDFSDYRDTLHLQLAAYARLEPALLHQLELFSLAERGKRPLSSNTPADR
jgi:lysophospholipase L1-like esterase